MSHKNGNGQIPALTDATHRPIACGCGCTEFRIIPICGATYDVLNPRLINMAPSQKLQCLYCGLWLTYDREQGKWKTVAMELRPLNPVVMQ